MDFPALRAPAPVATVVVSITPYPNESPPVRNLLIPTGTSALALFAFALTFATAAPVSAGADVPPAEAVESIAEDAANARIANKLARAMLTCSTV